MEAEARARALRMLRALAGAIVEELESQGLPVNPRDVAARALHGFRETPEEAAERMAISCELEDHVRALCRKKLQM